LALLPKLAKQLRWPSTFSTDRQAKTGQAKARKKRPDKTKAPKGPESDKVGMRPGCSVVGPGTNFSQSRLPFEQGYATIGTKSQKKPDQSFKKTHRSSQLCVII